MSRRQPRATDASGRDGSLPQEPDGTRRDALLATEGGAGAELRGHVPQHPDGVVLVLHGGAQASRMPVAWWRLAVLRMAPFASTIVRRAGDDYLDVDAMTDGYRAAMLWCAGLLAAGGVVSWFGLGRAARP